MSINFDGKVVVITGAGGGLGRCYALLIASLGGKVVVNDFGTSLSGDNREKINNNVADKVVDEIRSKGGTAVANYDSVEYGHKIIETAVKNFGRVDVLINNAGILKDVTFQKMQEKDWDLIILVHLKGVFSCTKEAWKYMQQQKYGRIINTASAAGLYGNYGQANYSAAKMGLIGFTKSLAAEGAKYNIKVNCIAPLAGTRMTETILPKEIVDAMKPEYVAPVVAYLASDKCNDTGEIIEVGAGWVSKVRLQRSEGVFFPSNFTPDDVCTKWINILDFSNPSYPNSLQDSMMMASKNFLHLSDLSKEKNIGENKTKEHTNQNTSLKSDKIFHLIKGYFKNMSDNQAKELMQKVGSIFHFEILTSKDGSIASEWTINLKQIAEVHCGKVGSPSVTFTITDNDFVSVCIGELNPQMAFIQGRMKIKGDMRAATKFTPQLFPKISEEVLNAPLGEALRRYLPGVRTSSSPVPEASSSSLSLSASQTKWSSEAMKLKSYTVLNILRDYLSKEEGKSLSKLIGYKYQIKIAPRKGESPVSFIFDFKSSPPKVFEGFGECDATFTMIDDDFIQLVKGKVSPESAFIQGKLSIKGSMKAAMKFKPELFPKLSSL